MATKPRAATRRRPDGLVLRPDPAGRSRAEDDMAIGTEDAGPKACSAARGARPAGRGPRAGSGALCADLASTVVRPARHRDYACRARTGNGRKIADALWLLP
jgi:hypothetical protein